jgi:hypothetical protein
MSVLTHSFKTNWIIGMNIYLILYGLVALAALAAGYMKLNEMKMSLGSGLFVLGGALLLIAYGLRWFGAENSILAQRTVEWPPVINTCPDYLTHYTRTKNGKKEEACVDTVGVSRNGILARFPSSGPAPDEEKYFFSLTTTSKDESARRKELCDRAILNGLTWEGITNGESCILPDASQDSGASGSKKCS